MTKRVQLEQNRIRNFDSVLRVAKDLGYKVVVTGGNYITHEMYCTFEEYNEIYNLANGITTPAATKG